MAQKPRALVIHPVRHMNADINVTPLVDVVLVLLIIFMVVTPLKEKDIGVRVPATETVDQPPDDAQNQIVVRLEKDGTLKIASESVARDAYIDRLRGMLDKLSDDKKLVFVMADDDVNYGDFVSVLDGAKQAGAQTLGFTTEGSDSVPAK